MPLCNKTPGVSVTSNHNRGQLMRMKIILDCRFSTNASALLDWRTAVCITFRLTSPVEKRRYLNREKGPGTYRDIVN